MTESRFPELPIEAGAALSVGVTIEEVWNALFDMPPFRAPDPDEYQAVFYQTNWDIICHSLLDFVHGVFEGGRSMAAMNSTLIALIPKVQVPKTIHQFRLISFCNVSYKLTIKIVANRLQKYMPSLILPYQSSFIPGRHIQDNIIVAQELIHSKRMMKRKKGFMVLKIDLEKAYDHLSWDFLNATLSLVGISKGLIRIIMDCVSSSVMQLAHLILDSVLAGRWKPIKIEVSENQTLEIMRILDVFCGASGQKVSPAKSIIHFLRNVADPIRSAICHRCSFTPTDELGRYLGIPIVHGRVRKSHFQNVVARVRNRLSGRSSSPLSMAGRTTLIKLVIQSITFYTMQVVSLPRGICVEIDKLCQNFLRGHKEDQKKLHMVPGYGPLLEQVVSVPSAATLHKPVTSFVTSSRGWDWPRISTYLNHASLLCLASVLPPSSDTSGSDIPFCRLSSPGDYSVSSAYKLLTLASGLSYQSRLWKTIWLWEGPQLIRLFLWRVAGESLLTNEARFKRHLSPSLDCSGCNLGTESTLHALRDYALSKPIWSGTQAILRTALGFRESWAAARAVGGSSNKDWMDIRWLKPPGDFLKLNIDGSVRGNPRIAGAGGLIRNDSGGWVIGFVQNIGITSVTMAKL
ncbi:hypothetical protein CRG98_034262 [Punica granatum]|uniref:Reverse transcriptase domain-containing protein n=1 Tax=Punica granatum TaxID=22663 RepID=A0A2I0IMV9_PUNGR|nr:hypothetical protein CRG98_034262 [Punica granatum]